MKFHQVNPFIKAHGASPGPLMRPRLTGVVASLFAAVTIGLPILTLHWSGRGAVGDSVSVSIRTALLCYIAFSVVSGAVYGGIYRRAANDRRGGWIFGASTGFIFWMINPAIWMPWLGIEPVFVGRLGLIVMLLHVAHGAVMGAVYPWLHLVCAKKNEVRV